ncbi:hypothetical protein [Sphingomonas sp. RS2018]
MALTINLFVDIPMVRLSGDVGAILEPEGTHGVGDRFVVELSDGRRLSGRLGVAFDEPGQAAGVRLLDYSTLGTDGPVQTLVNGVAEVSGHVAWAKVATPHAIDAAERHSEPTIANDEWVPEDPD